MINEKKLEIYSKQLHAFLKNRPSVLTLWCDVLIYEGETIIHRTCVPSRLYGLFQTEVKARYPKCKVSKVPQQPVLTVRSFHA